MDDELLKNLQYWAYEKQATSNMAVFKVIRTYNKAKEDELIKLKLEL
jgi:hypothetical protein